MPRLLFLETSSQKKCFAFFGLNNTTERYHQKPGFGIPCETTHNDGHVWFLYDPQTRQYRFAFSLAGEPTVNEETQQITEEWWIDTVTDSYITSNTYEYNDQGPLSLVDSRIEE